MAEKDKKVLIENEPLPVVETVVEKNLASETQEELSNGKGENE